MGPGFSPGSRTQKRASSQPSPVEMEQAKVNMSKELGPDTAAYCCPECRGDESWSCKHLVRGRAKSRSLSASPALGSTKEFRRTRSLHGPCPVTTFGPKACVLQNPQTIMHIQDPASQRLTWNKSPKSVLVIKKIRDASLLQPFKELCMYLMEENGMIVYVEKKVLEDPAIACDDNFGPVKKRFCTFREDYDDISNQIDFIICLGGDGTLLYASSLFQGSVPPVMAFHLGSLGFLTPFTFKSFQSQLTQVIEGNAAVVLRSRLKVRVVKEPRSKKMAEHNGLSENGLPGPSLEGGKQALQYQGPLLVPVQRGCLPGRTPHHHGAGRRSDRVHPNGQHGVRGRGRCLHDPPQRASHHDHTHLPSLAVLPAHRGPRRGGAEDHAVTRSQEHCVGVLGRTEAAGDTPWRQHHHHHLLLPAPLHLRPRPCE
ncbi:NAD kinase isoform X4 [Heterocephalus glaber]|uniref:NAD(+) kinase n=1 Tax=Heterocephalus glaber TaxID=10181 RepID=A0AAX6QHC1_HETGA|nr:NAD kinase isoform X4 [Heterocephalus glaber]